MDLANFKNIKPIMFEITPELQTQLDVIPGWMEPIILEVISDEAGTQLFALANQHFRDDIKAIAEPMPDQVVMYGRNAFGENTDAGVRGIAKHYRVRLPQ